MKKLAIRQKIGEWVYYITSFTFKEVSEKIQPDWKEEMGMSNDNVEDRMQRDLTNNVNSIATYIRNQKDMFFNSLVLAVYNGNPQWREIRIEYEDQESYNAGILELTEQDKIFPVDGQHRVEGIRKVINETHGNKNGTDNYYNNQTIPVILVAHENTANGKKRTRRLFTTLNRYAKPVNKTDIVLLDEDDIVAIATRYILESVALFQNERVLLNNSNAIPEYDRYVYTNIQTLYDCNIELLKLHLNLNDYTVIDGDNEFRVKGNQKGVNAFIKFRRSDNEINSFINFISDFWNAFSNIDCICDYLKKSNSQYLENINICLPDENGTGYDALFLRGTRTNDEQKALDHVLSECSFCDGGAICMGYDGIMPYPFAYGGNLLFRRIGQLAAIKAAIRLFSSSNDFAAIFDDWNFIDFSLGNFSLWDNIAYNPTDKSMVMSNNKLIEDLLVYITIPTALSEEKQKNMIAKYVGATIKTRAKPQFEETQSQEERELQLRNEEDRLKTEAKKIIDENLIYKIKKNHIEDGK